jgi:Stress responsive A/B Barrel Domain
MIVHVLRFRFKDGTAQEDIAACMEALQRVGRMDSVSFAVIGQYAGPATDRYTHSAAFALADIEAFHRYIYEPAHREADFIVHPHVTNFDVFDISDEENPDLSSEIAEIQQGRLAADRELASLISVRPED